MILKNNFFLFCICLFFISCDKKAVFDTYKNVGTSAWHKDTIITFEIEDLEKNTPYNLFLNIRNNNSYEFDNLFLIVSLEHPNKNTEIDTLEYVMANPDGSLLGEGFSDTKENKLVYKENYVFSSKGTYKISVEHAMRKLGKIPGEDLLKGVTDVGLRIETKN